MLLYPIIHIQGRRRFWHAIHGCVAPYVDIILHRGRFWAKSAASGSVRWWCFGSCWMVLSHVMRGRPGGPIKTVHFEMPYFSANADRFSKFCHQVMRKEILYVHITKISTSPAFCCYITLWKSKMLLTDSTSTNCWHVPENTLRTWFNILTVAMQTVSRLLTLID